MDVGVHALEAGLGRNEVASHHHQDFNQGDKTCSTFCVTNMTLDRADGNYIVA